jgi:capsular polysaccharide transport system permease protein
LGKVIFWIAKPLKFGHLSRRSFGPSDNLSQKSYPKMISRIRGRLKRTNALFIAVVIIPTALSILYFGIFTSDVYLSESRFVVRSPDKPASSGLGVILKTAGFSNAGDEIYAAQSFVVSRDAFLAVNHGNTFRDDFSRPSITIYDLNNPTGFFGSFEELFQYYRGKVAVEHDSVSSISTLTVRAYTPDDAHRLNRQLLEMAEATVNRLNVRGRQDLIRFAQSEVDDAKQKAQVAALNLANFRNVAGVVDPEKQAAVQLQMISKLQDELIAARNQLLQLRAYTPENPQIPVLQTRIQGLSRDIDIELGKVAGGRRSLAASAAQYQRMLLESQVADKQLAGAIASLEEARNEAGRKQAYVERIVQPNRPDEAVEPRRLRGIFGTFIFGLIAYGIISMLLAGMREHRD